MAKTFDLALKCRKCWGQALFMDFVGGHVELTAAALYDRHGAQATPSNGTLLCPLCGGYLDLHVFHIDVTEPGLRDELRKAIGNAN